MHKIIVSGFGGQGVLSLGQFISYAAMYSNYNTSWIPAYGPEMRGGTANCSVVVSSAPIASPVISRPNFVVALNQPSVDKFIDKIADGGTLLINESIVKNTPQIDSNRNIKVIKIKLDEIASLINPKGGNIIMLGVLLKLFNTISYDAALKAIEKVFSHKPQLIDINKQCLKAGFELI